MSTNDAFVTGMLFAGLLAILIPVILAWLSSTLRPAAVAKLDAQLLRNCQGDLKKITVVPGPGLFNNKCFLNAVSYVLKQQEPNDWAIHEVLAHENGTIYLHYVVRDPDWYFSDVTLGHLADVIEYYDLGPVSPDEYYQIHKRFLNTRSEYNKRYLKWYHKFLEIENVV